MRKPRKHQDGFHSPNVYRNECVRAAKDLGYGEEVINLIKNAKDDNEISRIMTDARENKR